MVVELNNSEFESTERPRTSGASAGYQQQSDEDIEAPASANRSALPDVVSTWTGRESEADGDSLLAEARKARLTLEALLDKCQDETPSISQATMLELNGLLTLAECRLRPLLYPPHPMLAAAVASQCNGYPGDKGQDQEAEIREVLALGDLDSTSPDSPVRRIVTEAEHRPNRYARIVAKREVESKAEQKAKAKKETEAKQEAKQKNMAEKKAKQDKHSPKVEVIVRHMYRDQELRVMVPEEATFLQVKKAIFASTKRKDILTRGTLGRKNTDTGERRSYVTFKDHDIIGQVREVVAWDADLTVSQGETPSKIENSVKTRSDEKKVTEIKPQGVTDVAQEQPAIDALSKDANVKVNKFSGSRAQLVENVDIMLKHPTSIREVQLSVRPEEKKTSVRQHAPVSPEDHASLKLATRQDHDMLGQVREVLDCEADLTAPQGETPSKIEKSVKTRSGEKEATESKPQDVTDVAQEQATIDAPSKDAKVKVSKSSGSSTQLVENVDVMLEHPTSSREVQFSDRPEATMLNIKEKETSVRQHAPVSPEDHASLKLATRQDHDMLGQVREVLDCEADLTAPQGETPSKIEKSVKTRSGEKEATESKPPDVTDVAQEQATIDAPSKDAKVKVSKSSGSSTQLVENVDVMLEHPTSSREVQFSDRPEATMLDIKEKETSVRQHAPASLEDHASLKLATRQDSNVTPTATSADTHAAPLSSAAKAEKSANCKAAVASVRAVLLEPLEYEVVKPQGVSIRAEPFVESWEVGCLKPPTVVLGFQGLGWVLLHEGGTPRLESRLLGKWVFVGTQLAVRCLMVTCVETYAEALSLSWPGMPNGKAAYSVEWRADDDKEICGGMVTADTAVILTHIPRRPICIRVIARVTGVVDIGADVRVCGPWSARLQSISLEEEVEQASGANMDPMSVARGKCKLTGCKGFVRSVTETVRLGQVCLRCGHSYDKHEKLDAGTGESAQEETIPMVRVPAPVVKVPIEPRLQAFKVVHKVVLLRNRPNTAADLVGSLMGGQIVRGVVKSGWLKLEFPDQVADIPKLNAPAFAIIDGRYFGFGQLLSPAGDDEVSSATMQDKSKLESFRVESRFVYIRSEPSTTAKSVGTLMQGDIVRGIRTGVWLRREAEDALGLIGHMGADMGHVLIDGSQLGLGQLLTPLASNGAPAATDAAKTTGESSQKDGPAPAASSAAAKGLERAALLASSSETPEPTTMALDSSQLSEMSGASAEEPGATLPEPSSAEPDRGSDEPA